MNKADEIRKLMRDAIYNTNKELIDYLLYKAKEFPDCRGKEASWSAMIKFENISESTYKMKLNLMDVANYFEEEGFITNFEIGLNEKYLTFDITIKW